MEGGSVSWNRVLLVDVVGSWFGEDGCWVKEGEGVCAPRVLILPVVPVSITLLYTFIDA